MNALSQYRPNSMLDSVTKAVGTANAFNRMQRDQQMNNMLQQHGPGIMAGDQNALNALAAIDPQAALGIRSTHQQMDYRTQANDRAAQQHQMTIEQAVASMDADELKREIAETEAAIIQGTNLYQSGDLIGLNQFLAGHNLEPLQSLDHFPALAAQYGDALEQVKKVAEFNAGPKPMSTPGKVQADINSGHLPQGTPLQSGGTSLTIGGDGTVNYTDGIYPTPHGQDPSVTNAPRDNKKLTQELGKNDAAEMKAVTEAARTASQLESLATQLETVAPNVGYTGPGGGLYGAIDDAIGVLPGDSGARGAFKSLSMEAQLTFTEKTKGAITDREMAMFKAAVPNLNQTPEANKMISQAMRAGAQRAQSRQAFYENWLRLHGSLEGAQEVWGEYMRDNPILADTGNGGIATNPEGDWNSYLRRKPAMAYMPQAILQMGRDEVGMVPIERLTEPQLNALERRMNELGL